MLAASRVAPAAACAGSNSWQEAAVHLQMCTDKSMCALGRQQQVASSSTVMCMQIIVSTSSPWPTNQLQPSTYTKH